MICPHCHKTIDINSDYEQKGKQQKYTPPNGFDFSFESGTYCQKTDGYDNLKNPVLWVTSFDVYTGEYSQESYPRFELKPINTKRIPVVITIILATLFCISIAFNISSFYSMFYLKDEPNVVSEQKPSETENALEPALQRIESAIVWKEPLIQTAVRKFLDKPSGAIVLSEISHIKSISFVGDQYLINGSLDNRTDVQNGEIHDLSDLKNFPELTDLEMDYQSIYDISTMPILPKLTRLSLHGNKISDITILSKFTNLETLYLGENRIRDLTPLTQLPNLHTLYIAENPIGNIDIVKNVENLFGADSLSTASDASFFFEIFDLSLYDLQQKYNYELDDYEFLEGGYAYYIIPEYPHTYAAYESPEKYKFQKDNKLRLLLTTSSSLLSRSSISVEELKNMFGELLVIENVYNEELKKDEQTITAKLDGFSIEFFINSSQDYNISNLVIYPVENNK